MTNGRLLVAVVILLFAGGGAAAAVKDPEADVRAVVAKLQDDWNRGDMEAYLAAYANTAATALLSGNTPLRSWQKIAEVYRRSYPDPGAMGRFEVQTLEVRPGEGGYAIASGTFRHSFPTLLVDGAFTLVLERDTSGRWLIVHEHTSRGGATTHN